MVDLDETIEFKDIFNLEVQAICMYVYTYVYIYIYM